MARGPDYAAIAKTKIVTPGSEGRMPRLLVYGRNKKGKSTFGNSAPNVLWVDPDDNPAPYSVDRWPVTKWEDLDEIYSFLRGGKHGYQWVNLDGVTKMYFYGMRWTKRQHVEGSITKRPDQKKIQEYGKTNDIFETMLHNFHSLRDIGIVLSAQERMIPVTEMDNLEDDEDHEPTSYQYAVSLPKGARAPLNAMVDLTGRIYVVRGDFTRRVKVDGEWEEQEYTKQRRLFIGVDDMYETGYRSNHVLPDVINDPTVTKVVRALRTGKVKQ